METLTIFTPTWNRAYTLRRLYQSLKHQTKKDFLWLIVDDGSTDNTEQLISEFINEKSIRIIYRRNSENRGKMFSHNLAVKETNTSLFLCVDSDDYLSYRTVENILSKYPEIERKPELVGFIAYKKIINPLCKNLTQFPNKIDTIKLSHLYKTGFVGDTTLIFKTKIIKNYLFPEIPNEKFITEAYIYDQIDQKYSYKLLPEYLTICEYLEDGYTKNADKYRRENPIGCMMYYEQRARFSNCITEIIKYYSKAFLYKKIAAYKGKFKFSIKLLLAFPFAILLKKIKQ